MLNRFFSLLFAFGMAVLAQARGAEDWRKELTVPLMPESPLIKAARQSLHELLAGVEPSQETEPAIRIKGDHYILHGRLFGTRDSYALVDLPDATSNAGQYDWSSPALAALALWRDGSWHLQGLWKIPVTWRPKGWKQGDAESFPVTPSTQPFKLVELSGDRIPEIVIAGEIDKYFQERYLLQFSPKEKTLHILKTSRADPVKIGRYVRLYTNWGRRGIFDEWQYYQWSGGDFVEAATWHDETPYNDPEHPFIDVWVAGKLGQPAISYQIVPSENEADLAGTQIITRDGQPYATVSFLWPKDRPERSNAMENAWLFQRLTGLPRDAFPHQDDSPQVPLPKEVSIKVSGSKEAVRQLRR